MRGLPPVPDDVALLEYFYDVDGSPATTWHWILHPDLQLMQFAELQSYWVDIVFRTLAPITDLMAVGGRVARVALRRFGSAPLTVVDGVADNHGAAGEANALMAAAGVYWPTQFAGPGGRAYTRWPAFPDSFTDDRVRLNDIGRREVGARSKDFLFAVNEAHPTSFGPGTLVSLHRQRGGAPLAVAEARQIVTAVPVERIAAVVRRARI